MIKTYSVNIGGEMPNHAPLTYTVLKFEREIQVVEMLLSIVICYSIRLHFIILIVVSENEKKSVSQFLTDFTKF